MIPRDVYYYRLLSRDGFWDPAVGNLDTLAEACAAAQAALACHWLTHRGVAVSGWEGADRIESRHYHLNGPEGELRPISAD